MAEFAEPPMSRDQLVLFPDKLDNSIGSGAPVRLLDAILDRLDWKEWESGYNLVRGQPPIHPRVIAGVILYGLLKGIRSTRLLEEAIQYRLDFRWLVQERSIDHTTISKFRTKHAEQIRDLYVKIAVIAQETGDLSLNTLGFDGTRIRANNRRSATRSPEALRKAKKELGEKYDELNASISKLDEEDAKRHDEIGRKVKGNRAEGILSAGSERKNKKPGVGNGRIAKKAFEVGLRDGRKITEKQCRNGQSRENEEDFPAQEIGGKEWSKETHEQDETRCF